MIFTAADKVAAQKLVTFLVKYLGRKGSRPLNASTIAQDLGFGSEFCTNHASGLLNVVKKAFKHNQKYSELIEKLWCNFVSYLRDQGSTAKFELPGYSDELYILTLAKLLCANIIEKKALLSNNEELKTILDGGYFQNKGLLNLVEYDYFGWLNHTPYVQDLLPISPRHSSRS